MFVTSMHVVPLNVYNAHMKIHIMMFSKLVGTCKNQVKDMFTTAHTERG